MVLDNATLRLNNITELETEVIAGTTYLFGGSFLDAGASVFAIASDGTLINVANLSDDATLALNRTFSLATGFVGTQAFLVGTGDTDDGASVIKVDTTGFTITGTVAFDIIDATHAPAGEMLPADLADTLLGLAGNDVLNGGKGADSLDGGDDNDTLQIEGSDGASDTLLGGDGIDTLQLLGAGFVTRAGLDTVASSIEIFQGNGQGLLGDANANLFDFRDLSAISGLPFVDAGAGGDTVIGSNFADDLRGGAGNDVLNGGLGADALSGGVGQRHVADRRRSRCRRWAEWRRR